jgi:hypothetical protein
VDDISGLQVTAGAFGVVSVSALLMLLIQRCKDYWPAMSGRGAMLTVDAMSLLVTLIVLYQVGVDWRDGATYVAVFMGTLSLGIITRGHYASAYHVKVEGQPVSAEASVPAAAVHDPQADEPYETEVRKPIAYTRDMTDAERRRVSAETVR